MLYYLAAVLYMLVCLSLMLVVLLQQGKGGDIANAFGGGASQAAFGARSGATVLSRATTVLAVLFMVGALALGIMRQKTSGGSVIGGRAPAPTTPAGTPAPARTPAPAGTTTVPATGSTSTTTVPATGTTTTTTTPAPQSATSAPAAPATPAPAPAAPAPAPAK